MESLSGLSVHLGFSGAEAEHREGVAGAGSVHLNVKAGHSPGTHPDSGVRECSWISWLTHGFRAQESELTS